MRSIRIILLSISLVLSFSVRASDWQYAGASKVGQEDETFIFYDSQGIKRPSQNLARYWIKLILRTNLDFYYEKHKKLLLEKTARKIISGHTPNFYRLEAIRSQYQNEIVLRDAITEIVMYEVIANEPVTPLFGKVYLEIDCNERKFRNLEIIFFDSKGNTSKNHPAQENFLFIPPDSNGEWQSQIICQTR